MRYSMTLRSAWVLACSSNLHSMNLPALGHSMTLRRAWVLACSSQCTVRCPTGPYRPCSTSSTSAVSLGVSSGTPLPAVCDCWSAHTLTASNRCRSDLCTAAGRRQWWVACRLPNLHSATPATSQPHPPTLCLTCAQLLLLLLYLLNPRRCYPLTHPLNPHLGAAAAAVRLTPLPLSPSNQLRVLLLLPTSPPHLCVPGRCCRRRLLQPSAGGEKALVCAPALAALRLVCWQRSGGGGAIRTKCEDGRKCTGHASTMYSNERIHTHAHTLPTPCMAQPYKRSRLVQ